MTARARPRQTLASPSGGGLTVGEIRKAAGFSLEDAAADLRAARDAYLGELQATKVERITHMGVVTAEFHDVDHATRHRGADGLVELWGAKPSKSAQMGDGAGPTNILIHISDGQAPRVVDVIDVPQVPAAAE